MEMGRAGRARRRIPSSKVVIARPWWLYCNVLWSVKTCIWAYYKDGDETRNDDDPISFAVVSSLAHQHTVKYEVSKSQLVAPSCWWQNWYVIILIVNCHMALHDHFGTLCQNAKILSKNTVYIQIFEACKFQGCHKSSIFANLFLRITKYPALRFMRVKVRQWIFEDEKFADDQFTVKARKFVCIR